MFKFPKSVKIKLKDRTVEFKIVEVTKGIFALKNHMHEMHNRDDFTFGYIVYRDSHLYAYTVSTDPKSSMGHTYRLIYLAYVGPEEEEDDEIGELIPHIFKAIACSVIQISRHENRHPAILDKDRFDNIYDEIVTGLQDGETESVTPFIKPLYELAKELRDFYTDMTHNLEVIQDQLSANEEELPT